MFLYRGARSSIRKLSTIVRIFHGKCLWNCIIVYKLKYTRTLDCRMEICWMFVLLWSMLVGGFARKVKLFYYLHLQFLWNRKYTQTFIEHALRVAFIGDSFAILTFEKTIMKSRFNMVRRDVPASFELLNNWLINAIWSEIFTGIKHGPVDYISSRLFWYRLSLIRKRSPSGAIEVPRLFAY